MLSLVIFPAKHLASFSFSFNLCEQLDQLLNHFHHDWLVLGKILLNKMWLSHTCPPFLSAGWNVNTSVGDSVLAPVFTEREINKLLNFKACISSSSRVHFGQGCQVFLCLWPSFEMTSCLRKTPSICPQHLFLKMIQRSLLSLHCCKNLCEGGAGTENVFNFPSKLRYYTWYSPYRHRDICIAHVHLHML